MKLRHAITLALVGCALSACSAAGLAADDPCRSQFGPALVAACEQNRAASTHNALLDDYRKCVDANVTDPTKCSAILQGLHAYSVNVGANAK